MDFICSAKAAFNSGSFDQLCTRPTLAWTKISGPGTVTFVDPALATTSAVERLVNLPPPVGAAPAYGPSYRPQASNAPEVVRIGGQRPYRHDNRHWRDREDEQWDRYYR